MKAIFITLLIAAFSINCFSQKKDIWMKIDTSTKVKVAGTWKTEYDTTLLELSTDSTFIYKWSPLFGPSSSKHIYTNGKYKRKGNSVYLTSRYQLEESELLESFRPEYGDTMIKVFVQTYDSLIGFIHLNFVFLKYDTMSRSKMLLFTDTTIGRACYTTFPSCGADTLIFYGDFGHTKPFVPKSKKSNHFIIRLNWSTNWDYQYMTELPCHISRRGIRVGEKKDGVFLKKVN